MLREEIKNIPSTKKDLRSFGLVVGGVIVAIAGALYWYQKPTFIYFLVPGAALMIFGLILPTLLKPFQKAWMTFAVILGWFMTRLILSALFFVGFTSIHYIGKLVGKSFLDVKWDKSVDTYWQYREDVPFEKTRYEQQF